MVKIGIIGGSGLDNPEILKDATENSVSTPFGEPSSSLKTGVINGVEVVILSRHGREHTIPPTNVNHRANVYALKNAGCDYILATSAVGSLREDIERGDLVIPDQFIDFTRRRPLSIYDEFKPHEPKHAQMAEPFSQKLRKILIESALELGLKHHEKGTVITIEGSRFSTRAESRMFRFWGADVINMSIAPEVICANELGIPYAAVAMSTDYDCWKTDEEAVSWEQIIQTMEENASKVIALFLRAIPKIGESIKSKIRTVPDWPKPGIMFRDVTTLFKDSEGLNECVEKFYSRYKEKKIDIVAGIEARGFMIGSVLAYKLGAGFVPVRKKGKLPAETLSEEYMLEYGADRIEVHKDAILPGQKVLIADDLIATAGTMATACNLVKGLGGEIVECAAIVELTDLGGRKKLEDAGYSVYTIATFKESDR